ncbi:ABC transporter permease subunit [Swaminathania salitolerans]|uniref:ABC transporter permease n=1 Tax=Swaminathania salitolerans TaxID=182838 RepID=A0A511BPC1_9PROT|nr:ribose ABC transporter permease [Swaminathania salitolerans]GBQ10840.1 monosaccharide-transporting ATPase [Swaminathania salitolerans LMG 21291]GEL02189.1 ABC transporter permease [Swaminathania salitolerans]
MSNSLTSTASVPPVARHDARSSARSLFQAAGMLPALILLALGFHFLGGHRFLTGANLSIIAQQASINTVLASGMTFVILTGGIDLSVGSILAFAAMCGLIVSLMPGLAWLAIPACLGAGLLIGLFNGALIAGVRIPPFIVTLGTLTAVRGLARLMGNDRTIFNADLSFAWIGNDGIAVTSTFTIPWLAVIALAVVVASWFILRRTVLGVHIYAIGGNPAAARLSGIRVGAVLMFVYAASGVLAGLGAVMSSARLYAANGLQLGQSYELDAIAAVILGGTSFVGGIGSIWGTLVGALLIAVLSNGLILVGVSDIWQFIVKGLVIIVAVALDRFRAPTART